MIDKNRVDFSLFNGVQAGTREQKCKLLAKNIIEIFENGILLDNRVKRYIDSVFSSPSVKKLAEKLQDYDDCETASVYELIFLPDKAVRISIEPLLEKENFIKEDVNLTVKYIIENRPRVCIKFDGELIPIAKEMLKTVTEKFMHALNIEKRIDKKVLEAVNTYINGDSYRQLYIKAELRNMTNRLSIKKISFLIEFFKKLDQYTDTALIDFLFEFIDNQNDMEVRYELLKTQQYYAQLFKKAEEYDKILEKGNIETLILKGVRIPYINRDQALLKIKQIDTILYCID